ncbi:MAG: four-carbon acid sugar kinase family protein [Candidatus Azotimanducaceae bacterium]
MLELGILADDLTGGMMVASLLEAEGIRCPLVSSVEALAAIDPVSAEAVVVARKIRLIDPHLAVNEAQAVVAAMKKLGIGRFYYKYCATFDCTDRGNIGPVALAMLEASGGSQTIFCPAFPRHTVTVFQGRMFIGATPLADSFKKHDPVTPMLNSNLVEVLEPQTPEAVGLIPHGVLVQGVTAVEALLAKTGAPKLYIADTADDADLERISELVLDWPLTTGADALPVFLSRAWRQRKGIDLETSQKTLLAASPGREAVIAGSCAGPTLRQLKQFAQQHPVFYVNLLEAEDVVTCVQRILAWVKTQPEDQPLAIATSDDVDDVEKNQAVLGREGAAVLADRIIGEVAQGLFALGFRKFVVAGGETSGQVINSLDIARVEVSAFDELGGGYCHQAAPEPVSLVLKAGALGQDDFFFQALDRMRLAEQH